jgi:hypothetical protein
MVVLSRDAYPNTFAVGVLIAWLVPRVYMDWNRTLMLVRKNHLPKGKTPTTGTTTPTSRTSTSHCDDNEDDPELQRKLRKVHKNAILSILLWSTILIVSSALVAYYTNGLDERMVLILGGMSRIFTAGVCVVVSLELPQWLGVYDYVSAILDNRVNEDEKKEVAGSKHLRTSTTTTNTTTPPAFSLRVAIFEMHWAFMGQFARIYWIVQLFSGGGSSKWGLPVSYITGLMLGMLISYGVYYGRTRLTPTRRRRCTYFCMVFLSVMGCVLCAFGSLFIQEVWNPDSSIQRSATAAVLAFVCTGILTGGLHFLAYKGAKQKAVEKEAKLAAGEAIPESHYNSELFTPPITTNIGPTIGSAATGILQYSLSLNSSVGSKRDKDQVEKEKENENEDAIEEGIEEPSTDNDLTASSSTPNGVDSSTETTTPDQKEEQGEEEPQVCEVCSFEEPSFYSLCLSRIRCCKCCCVPCGWSERGIFSRLNTKGKIVISLKWFIRFVGHGLCVYATIVNIGATQQGNYAKELFPTVDEILYVGQESGPVCAYEEPFNDALTQTFENAQAAYDVNYTIAHCGACASCSTWQNLELQWTTRYNLAILSEACAKKIIFGGYDKAIQCHLDTIGFDVPCSECWVAVEECAIQYCSFIQMQAWIIDNLGNFEVGPDVVTAAMCEEAICEVTFVPCSGANRRRMNIVSDIARPGTQQCPLVPNGNEKWFEMFGPVDPPIR